MPTKLKTLVVIPSRYASTRLPAKPLLRETGKYMVQHVWEAAKRVKNADRVVIATDDERILLAAAEFGAEAVMTSSACRSGTDRVAETARKIPAELYINIQGDEPELEHTAVEKLISAMHASAKIEMGTIAVRRHYHKSLEDPSIVKAVVGADMRALYFSRSLIPHDRDGKGRAYYWHHLGVYAYRAEFLKRFVKMPPSVLEETEKLEQLRAVENGVRILVVPGKKVSQGIDTPKDYTAFVKRYKS
jgi:3-deoxy-manno-octulosonate cytidylyltransferase (CMP-KDO synthetase)